MTAKRNGSRFLVLSAAAAQLLFHAAFLFVPAACSFAEPAEATAAGQVELSATQRAECERLGLDTEEIAGLVAKPLYEFTEAEVDAYLQFLHATEPDVRRRVVHLARKNLGQPYEIYLLGELPFEAYDPQPLYCLGKSDCLVYSEHTYAMALGHNWSSFMGLLQRIRYRDGRLGVVTRNHYTEVDWNSSNRWLVRDRTTELAGERAVTFEQRIDRSSFFQKRYGMTVDIPVQTHRDVYLPFEAIELAKPHLKEGDFVNIVRGIVKTDAPPNETFGGSAWVGHVGLIIHGDDGAVHLIHSAKPAVREEVLDDYIAKEAAKVADRDAAGKSRLLGFKFLRLEEDPLENLREIDGPQAPKVTLPSGGPLQFE